MIIRIKILLAVLFVFLVINLTAQEFYNSVRPLTTESNTLNYKLTGNQYYFHSTLKGTVYLNDEMLRSNIKLVNGDRYEGIYAKLNTLLDEVIVYNERTGATFILDKSIVDEFEMGKEVGPYNLFRKVYSDKVPKGYHYFNVLYDGDVKLYLWYRTFETKTSVYDDSQGIRRDSQFEPIDSYYLVFPDNSIHRVQPNKRRAFLNLFPEQKRNLRKLFRKNKVQFNSNQELVRATQLIEQEIF